MTLLLKSLCGAFTLAAALAIARPVSAKPAGNNSAAETDFRRRAAAFRKLRRLPKNDAAWGRRYEDAVHWFVSNGDIVADGHRSCAEIKRRLGPPDPPSPFEMNAPRSGPQADALPEERLEYSSSSCDAVGCGRIVLIIGCHRGKPTAVALDTKAT
jgi:hypothetical protein